MRIWSWQHVSAIHCWVELSLLLSSLIIQNEHIAWMNWRENTVSEKSEMWHIERPVVVCCASKKILSRNPQSDDRILPLAITSQCMLTWKYFSAPSSSRNSQKHWWAMMEIDYFLAMLCKSIQYIILHLPPLPPMSENYFRQTPALFFSFLTALLLFKNRRSLPCCFSKIHLCTESNQMRKILCVQQKFDKLGGWLVARNGSTLHRRLSSVSYFPLDNHSSLYTA